MSYSREYDQSTRNRKEKKNRQTNSLKVELSDLKYINSREHRKTRIFVALAGRKPVSGALGLLGELKKIGETSVFAGIDISYSSISMAVKMSFWTFIMSQVDNSGSLEMH